MILSIQDDAAIFLFIIIKERKIDSDSFLMNKLYFLILGNNITTRIYINNIVIFYIFLTKKDYLNFFIYIENVHIGIFTLDS